MKLYLRIIYGWLTEEHGNGIDELEQALSDSLKPFGFETTGSKIDSSGVKDLSFEADELEVPANQQ